MAGSSAILANVMAANESNNRRTGCNKLSCTAASASAAKRRKYATALAQQKTSVPRKLAYNVSFS